MGSGERIKGKESLVEVACCQFEPHVGDKTYNVTRSLELIAEAAAIGAQLIVLPELCNSGYVFNSREEAFSLAESVPDGETVFTWEKAANKYNVYIIAGICEKEGSNLYNSSVLIGPDGYIGTYRKIHLWYEEKLFFEPGNLGVPVFSTPFGRIGLLICYDIWFPEVLRMCSLKGADIVGVSTNWVPMPGQGPEELPMAVHLCMANAHVNGLFIAAADRVGVEREQPFLGHSVIVGPTGQLASGPASGDNEEIIMASCNLSESRRTRSFNELNHILRDRREEVYEIS